MLRFLAYFSPRAARRLDRQRFARKYVLAVKSKRRADFWDRMAAEFWRGAGLK